MDDPDMPQPLSRVRSNASYSIGAHGWPALPKRPELAALAMEAIASWSNVEAELLAAYIQLMGGKDDRAAIAYLSLDTQNAKSRIITAVADAVLSELECKVLNAILRIAKTHQRKRDKLAHWVWGISDDLPDALLLANPKKMHSGFPDRSDIFVYTKRDFEEIIADNNRLAFMAGCFIGVIRRPPDVRESFQPLETLCRAPEIREILDLPDSPNQFQPLK
ncbi:hypothetical protein [uncultured Hoeflea sp.]|uniref:hypothetical protein n=1 Tax=uncultured Hoeflea sp. TaxID=538666 RepID=UPI0030ED2CE0